MSLVVLLPVYNAKKYLKECIDSILAQSYRNFILIPCDDGSSDGCWELLTDYARTDDRIKPIRNPRNMGIVYTRNHLLSAIPAGTEFIAWVDADDVCFPNRFRTQIDYLTAHQEIGGVGGALEIIDENSRPYGVRRYPETPAEIRQQLPLRNVLAQPAMMVRYEVIKTIGNYDQTCPVCQDYEYWLRVLEYYDFANLPEILLHYRISKTQVKQTKLKLSLKITMRIQRNYFRRTGKSMGFKGWLWQLTGHILLLLPSKLVLKIFCLLTYRKD